VNTVQNVGQRFHSLSDPVRGRTLLARRNIRVLAAHRLAALLALPGFHRIKTNLGGHCGRNVGSGDNLLTSFAQSASAARATSGTHRHRCRFLFLRLRRLFPKPEISLTRFPSGRLRIRLAPAFGKRRPRTPLFQLLNIGPYLLD
jgi:hypothetical protein